MTTTPDDDMPEQIDTGLVDFQSAQPEPAELDLSQLNLPPMPAAPAVPPRPVIRVADAGETETERRKRQVLSLATLALLAGGGTRFTGLGQGVVAGLASVKADQERRQRDALSRAEFEQQAADQQWQAEAGNATRAYQATLRRQQESAQERQRLFRDAIASLRQMAPAIKSEAEYRRQIDESALSLQRMGLRVTSRDLMAHVRWIKPDAAGEANKVIDRIVKDNPGILADPERMAKVSVRMDMDGDGVPETPTSMPDLLRIAGRTILGDPKVLQSPFDDQEIRRTPELLEASDELRVKGVVVDRTAVPALKNRIRKRAAEIARAREATLADARRAPAAPGGSTAGGQAAAAVRLRNQRTAAAMNTIERLKRLAPERAPGPLGIIQGAGEVVKGYAGYSTRTRQYQALINPAAMQAAAAIQGAANLSDNERRVMAGMLGSIGTMDYASQMALLDQALELLKHNADVVEQGGVWHAADRVAAPIVSHGTPDSPVRVVRDPGTGRLRVER